MLYTNEKKDVLHLFDCSYVTVSDLRITVPNGGTGTDSEYKGENLIEKIIRTIINIIQTLWHEIYVIFD